MLVLSENRITQYNGQEIHEGELVIPGLVIANPDVIAIQNTGNIKEYFVYALYMQGKIVKE